MRSELDQFAISARGAVSAVPTLDAWRPGTYASDRSSELSASLERLGWHDLTSGDEDTLPFLAVAALELGRQAASPYDVIMLLGGSPLIAGLAMYGEAGQQAASIHSDGYTLATITRSNPVMFADSLGVHSVSGLDEAQPVDGDADNRQAAWEAATVGYFAGLASFVVDAAIEHARGREIFGRTLAHLDAVQQRLADAATSTEALVLSAREGAHGHAILAHAVSSAWSVMLHGHMIFGAMGFTLEFPLQRYSRRVKALGAFVDGWIDRRIEYGVLPLDRASCRYSSADG